MAYPKFTLVTPRFCQDGGPEMSSWVQKCRLPLLLCSCVVVPSPFLMDMALSTRLCATAPP